MKEKPMKSGAKPTEATPEQSLKYAYSYRRIPASGGKSTNVHLLSVATATCFA
jgi:hypothetical protein